MIYIIFDVVFSQQLIFYFTCVDLLKLARKVNASHYSKHVDLTVQIAQNISISKWQFAVSVVFLFALVPGINEVHRVTLFISDIMSWCV